MHEYKIWKLKSIIFALCVIVSGTAHAQQRPLVTEDPETIGVGACPSRGRILAGFGAVQFRQRSQRRHRAPRLIRRERWHRRNRRNTDRRRASSASHRDRAASERSARNDHPLPPRRPLIEHGGPGRRHENSARVRDRVASGPWPPVRHQAADRGPGQGDRPGDDRLLRIVSDRKNGSIGAHGRKCRTDRPRQSGDGERSRDHSRIRPFGRARR